MNRIYIVVGFCTFTAACGVESQGQDTGGIDLGGDSGAAGNGNGSRTGDSQNGGQNGGANGATGGASADGGATTADSGSASSTPPRKARGFTVVNTDYDSTSVSLVSLEGEVLSESIISSSSEKPGLSAALSGDVVLPTSIVPGNEIVLLDRFPASVLTWVNLETAEVRAQLSVATGFSSNPHDYVPYSETKAFVTRYAGNLDHGEEPFDRGNDVLIVDPSEPEITGRIDLTGALEGVPSGIWPRADRALIAGGLLRVFAESIDRDFEERANSRVITIDPQTESITQVLVFDGMHSCGTAALSPDGSRIAVACTGAFGQDPSGGFSDAGVLIVDVGDDLTEARRFASPELGIDQVVDIAWTGPDSVVFVTAGRYNEDRSAAAAPDTVRWLDVEAGKLGDGPLLETEETPFSFTEVACAPSAEVCFVTDAETEGGVVHRLAIDEEGRVNVEGRFETDEQRGLPPRYLGKY